jgi:hypothetical protein
MNCEQTRELIGADPDSDSPELLAHVQACPACQAYREQMRALNARIFKALKLDWNKVQPDSSAAPASPLAAAPASPPAAPDGTASAAGVSGGGVESSNVAPFRRRERGPVARHKRPGLFAFSASLAAALVAGLVLWLSRPVDSLAAEVVTHVEHEPDSWTETHSVSREEIQAVLRKSGVKLGPGMEPVVYASACRFRGHYVPHLVVSTPHGPVTVMILLNERVSRPQQFNESGYSGLLVPAPTGSVAVLSRKPMELDGPAREVVDALRSSK